VEVASDGRINPLGWTEALDQWDAVWAHLSAPEPGVERWAVVDCGTNTFNLLIRDTNQPTALGSGKLPVKLGMGGLTNGLLAPDSMERGILALQKFAETAKRLGVSRLWAFATSGVRSTTNGAAFVARALDEAGVHLQVIDGLLEAEFIYRGVQQAYPLPNAPVLVMDIGGGSTEFIVGHQDRVLWSLSLPLGVTRLKEQFQPTNPLTDADLALLRAHVQSELEPVLEAIERWKPVQLIGSSGSFDTLFDVWALANNQPPLAPGQTRAEWPVDAFVPLCESLLTTTVEERLSLPGMVPMRADTLHLSPLQILPVLAQLPESRPVGLSTFALKEGVWLSLLQNPNKWPASSW
jgi:exopolyphosphatase/guanosine-5'-triphosphate,3'-diphosphate pyrophosphatase